MHGRWPAKIITKLRSVHLMPFKDVGSFVCELSAGPQYISAKAKHQSAHSQNAFLRVRCSFRVPQKLAPSGITSHHYHFANWESNRLLPQLSQTQQIIMEELVRTADSYDQL